MKAVADLIAAGRSLAYSEKSVGPRTLHWGIPAVTGLLYPRESHLDIQTTRSNPAKRMYALRLLKRAGVNPHDNLKGYISMRFKSGIACEQTLLSSAPRGFAARSRVLARLVSLAQIGELARRLVWQDMSDSIIICIQESTQNFIS